VGHLYRRAAFASSANEVASAVQRSPEEVVDGLLQGGGNLEEFEAGARQLLPGVLESNDPQQAQALWMHRLLRCPHQLLEKMTLFWHSHFATSNAKVNRAPLMLSQVETLRRHALGHFGDLLQAMTRDPAMLIWLDSQTNRKGAPNENFARELFELFSLGEGNYSEHDIQEAARALTGWSVENDQAVFTPAQFDDGEKTIFGQTGRFGAGDVVRLALGHPACALFLVRKLFSEFVSQSVTVSDELLRPLAEEFRIRNYDIVWLVRRILLSWVFYSPAAIAQRIKSPVEFVAGTVRSLSGRASPSQCVALCTRLGQSLMYPPSVKGWDGGDRWLNSTTLLQRQNFAWDVTRGTGPWRSCDPALLAENSGLDAPEEMARFFLTLFLHQAPQAAVDQVATALKEVQPQVSVRGGKQRAQMARAAAHLVLTMPEYQLG
jgi:uncharacterized protein (DUF1800 family)